MLFGSSIAAPTVLDGFTLPATNDTSNAAVTVEGSTGAVNNNNNIITGGAG